MTARITIIGVDCADADGGIAIAIVVAGRANRSERERTITVTNLRSPPRTYRAGDATSLHGAFGYRLRKRAPEARPKARQ